MDGLELKIARVRAGLTLCERGQKSGVHPARISEMERGQRLIRAAVVQALEKDSQASIGVDWLIVEGGEESDA